MKSYSLNQTRPLFDMKRGERRPFMRRCGPSHQTAFTFPTDHPAREYVLKPRPPTKQAHT
jgi:hypothetical protein